MDAMLWLYSSINQYSDMWWLPACIVCCTITIEYRIIAQLDIIMTLLRQSNFPHPIPWIKLPFGCWVLIYSTHSRQSIHRWITTVIISNDICIDWIGKKLAKEESNRSGSDQTANRYESIDKWQRLNSKSNNKYKKKISTKQSKTNLKWQWVYFKIQPY